MLRSRVATAVALAPLVVVGILLAPTPAFAIGAGLLLSLGLWEWSRLVGIEVWPPRAIYVAGGLAMMSAWWIWGWPTLPWLIVGGAWWVLAVAWLGAHHWGSQMSLLQRLTKAAGGYAAVVPAWVAVVALHGSGELGPQWTLLVILMIWAADTGAYFAGKRFGHRKLAPAISPGKTWAGALGGIAGGVFIAALGTLVFKPAPVVALGLVLLTPVIVAASIVGDLFVSALKRHVGAKDSGNLFPGHGGMLDRCDSLLSALPVFALVLIGLRLP